MKKLLILISVLILVSFSTTVSAEECPWWNPLGWWMDCGGEELPLETVNHINYQTTEYDLGSGKFAQTSNLRFINYYNGSEYLPIETEIVNSSDQLFDYEVTKGVYQSYFKENPTEGQVVKFVIDSDYITYQPMALNYRNDLSQLQQINMIQEVIGVANNNSFLYENAYGENIDLQYSYWNDYLREELIINSSTDLISPEQYIIDGGNPTLDLDFILTTNSNKIFIDELEWDKSTTKTTSNEVFIKDEFGNILYYLKKPYAYDSNGSMQLLTYNFRKGGQDLFVTIKTPYSWLNDPLTIYPVYIDPDTGATSPGTMVNATRSDTFGNKNWTNPDNAKSSDNSYATVSIGAGDNVNLLKATNFGFSIPGEAIIDGILLEVERKEDGTRTIADYEVKIVLANGSLGSEDKKNTTNWGEGVERYAQYGNSTDLWGETWNDTVINDANFGGVFSAEQTGGAAGSTISVDHMRITVFYTEGQESELIQVGAITNATSLGNVHGISYYGGYVYTAGRTNNLLAIFDVSDKTNPTQVGAVTTGALPIVVKTIGNYAYVSTFTAEEFEIYDVSDKTNPSLEGTTEMVVGGIAYLEVESDGNTAYVSLESYMMVIDTTDKANPIAIHNFSSSNFSSNGELWLNETADILIFVATDKFNIVNITDPNSPWTIGTLNNASSLTLAIGVSCSGDYCAVVGSGDKGLTIIDISDRTNPTQVGRITDAGNIGESRSVHLGSNDFVLLDSRDNDMLTVVNITDKTAPVIQDNFTNTTSMDGSRYMDVYGNYSYIAGYTVSYMTIINISDYAAIVGADTTLPKATIRVNNTSPTQNQHINISSNVTDETGLSHCIFWNNMTSVNSSPITLNGFSDECHNISIITPAAGLDILFKVYVNDTSNNWYENETTITVSAGPETIPPSWSNNITNDTDIRFNDTVVFNTTWSDETALSGWIFNSNITGVEVNQSFNTTFGPSNESTYVIKVNVLKDRDFWYRFYANDTSNNWNETDQFVFTVNNSIPTILAQNTFTNATTGNNFTVIANATDIDTATDFVFTSISVTVGSCALIGNSSGGDNFGVAYNCSGPATTATTISIGFQDAFGAYINTTASVNTFPDNIAPTWSNNITDDKFILLNEEVEFNTTWADETGLSGWIFNSNITGTEVNGTFNITWGPSNESTYSIIVNVTAGNDFWYRFYANDTSNNWNETEQFVFTVNSPPATTLFTTDNADGISVTPLTNTSFIVAWCDEGGDDIKFKQYDTNGTQIGNQVTVDSDVGNCRPSSVSVSAFNSTHFVIGWADDTDEDVSFRVYDSSENAITGIVDVDSDRGASYGTASVSAFNSTHFVIGWYDDADQDASFRTYTYDGTPITGIIDSDAAVGDNEPQVSVSAFNSTNFALGYFDYAGNHTSVETFMYNGTQVGTRLEIKDDVGPYASAVSVTTFNSTHGLIGYYDDGDGDVSFSSYEYDSNPLEGSKDVDTDSGETDSVSVAALNSTHFVVGWIDEIDNDASFRIYSSIDGTAVTGIIDSVTTADNEQDVASHLSAVNIGFCDDNFIHAYQINSSAANWTAYQPDGTLWDGDCIAYAVFEDPTPPDGTIDNTQVNINVSCTTGDVTLWFDTTANPTNKTINAAASPSNFSTQVTLDDTYYYKASCDEGAINSSIKQWSYDTTVPYLSFNTANFFNRFNTSVINFAESQVARLDITFLDVFNSSQFKINITNSTGNTIYNLTNLTLTGTSHRFIKNIDVSSTATGTYEVNITITDSAGNVNQTNYAYTLSGAGIDNCSAGGYPTIRFFMVNESRANESVIEFGNVSMDFFFQYYSLTSGGIRAPDNYSTGVIVANASFCLNPNGSTIVSNITIDYVYEGTYFTYQPFQLSLTNTTKSINLYVVTGTTEVLLNVKDTFDDPVEDAYITIEKWDVGTNTFKATEIVRTDTGGNALSRIVTSTAWYRFRIRYRGEVKLVDGPVKIISTTRNFRIDLIGPDWYDDFAVSQGVFHNLSFNNGTKVFVFHWDDPQLTIDQACLKVTQTNVSGSTILSDSCTASHSGSIQYDIGTNTSTVDKTYLAESYITLDGVNYILNSISISFDTDWDQWIEGDEATKLAGIFITLLLCITLAFAGLWHPGVSMILLLLGIGAMRILKIYYMSWTMYSTLVVLVILIIWRSQRR